MINLSVEDIKELVAKEKENEAELKKAQDEASHIIEEARKEAKAILSDVQDPSYFQTLHEQEIKRVEEKKSAWEMECNDALENLKSKAGENVQKTVDYVIKLIFGA